MIQLSSTSLPIPSLPGSIRPSKVNTVTPSKMSRNSQITFNPYLPHFFLSFVKKKTKYVGMHRTMFTPEEIRFL